MVFIFAGKSEKKNLSSRLAWAVCLFMAVAAISATSVMAQSSPLVNTDGNVFRGVAAPGMNEFLGIRYAQAPVGDLRWRAPRRPDHVDGIQDATQFANHCPQPASPFGLPSISEDCLFLNVFTPAQQSSSGKGGNGDHGHGLPVMFWMHGGALVVGEGDDYNPQRLVAQGVIVVTINYRLGALGFLAHPALSAEADRDDDEVNAAPGSGNYGIMDQQLALKWVKAKYRGVWRRSAQRDDFRRVSRRTQHLQQSGFALGQGVVCESDCRKRRLPAQSAEPGYS